MARAQPARHLALRRAAVWVSTCREGGAEAPKGRQGEGAKHLQRAVVVDLQHGVLDEDRVGHLDERRAAGALDRHAVAHEGAVGAERPRGQPAPVGLEVEALVVEGGDVAVERDVAEVVAARRKVVEVLEVVTQRVRRGVVGARLHVVRQARRPVAIDDEAAGAGGDLRREGDVDVEAEAGVVVEDVGRYGAKRRREDADLAVGGADAEVALPLVVDVQRVHVADDAVGHKVVGRRKRIDATLLLVVGVAVRVDPQQAAAVAGAGEARRLGRGHERAELRLVRERRAEQHVAADGVVQLVPILDVDRGAAQVVHDVGVDGRVVCAVERDALVDAALDDVAAEGAAGAVAHQVPVQAVLAEGDAAAVLDADPLDGHRAAAQLHRREALPTATKRGRAGRAMHLALGVRGVIGRVHWACALGVHWHALACIGSGE